METDTPRCESARFEALRSSAFRIDCIPLKLGQDLERELAESQAQSHGLARRVVEAETKLEVAEQQIRNCLEIIDDDAKEKSELKDEVAKINHQLLNTESDLIQSQAEVERLKKELDAWDYGTRAKREQSRAEKAEAEVATLNNVLENTRIMRADLIEERNLLDQELAASQAEVERLKGIANRAISTLVNVTYGEESIDFEWPDIMRKVGELRNEFPFLGSTTEESAQPKQTK